MEKDILIKNAYLAPDHREGRQDIFISKGKVAAVAPSAERQFAHLEKQNSKRDKSNPCKVINADGLTVIPGLVDVHVHLREPGFAYKETIAQGSEAAAAGGFTTVCTMPNLNPAPDSPETLQKQLDIIRRDAKVEVLPYATITKTRLGEELVDYAALAPYVAGFSDDGSGIQDEEVMRRAMQAIAPTGKILAAHCEVNELLRKGYIHDGEYARKHGHRGICSESEWREVERDIRLAEETGCRLHICHISTTESVQLIREGKARGVKVTCETAPHYLTFTDMDLEEDGRFKMNPPIRSQRDKDALIQGIKDGTIDMIATDHAPHSAEEKNKGLEKSAMGVVGLETAFSASYTSLVLTGIIPFERLVELMCTAPRRIFGIEGGINPGDRADITLVDTDKGWIVTPAEFKSKGRATPFADCILISKPVTTIYKGKIVYDER